MLLDPRDGGAIEARAKDRRQRPEHQGKSLQAIQDEIRDEILLAVIALFDCRDTCEIQLGFSTTTSPVRIEVLDDAIYTSLYRSSESRRNTHPETARFSRESQTYQIFRDECQRQMQLASLRRSFTSRDTDQELSVFVGSLDFTDVEEAGLRAQRLRYQEFIMPFYDAIDGAGGPA